VNADTAPIPATIAAYTTVIAAATIAYSTARLIRTSIS
jgi:hypothetical protein